MSEEIKNSEAEETKKVAPEAAEKDTEKKGKKAKKSKKPEKPLTEEEKKEKEAAEKKKAKNKPKDAKGSAKRLIGYLTAKKGWLVVVAVCVIVSTAIMAVSSLIMKPVYEQIDGVINPNKSVETQVETEVTQPKTPVDSADRNISFGAIMSDLIGDMKDSLSKADEAGEQGPVADSEKQVYDQNKVKNAMSVIVKYLIVMLAAYLVATAMMYAYQKIMLNLSVKILAQMRKELFDHIQTLPLSYFDKHKTGAIMSHFTNDVGKVSDLVQSTFVNIVSSAIQAVITITIMIIYSWRITLTITIAIALMMLVVMVITKICQPLFREQQKNLAACNAYIEEYIRGIKVVQIFSHEEIAKKEYGKLVDEYKRVGIKSSIIGGVMRPIMSMILRINYAAAVAIGAYQIINGKGNMDVPKLVTYLQYVGSYGSPVASIASSYSTLISALAGAERVFEVLDMDPETDDGQVKLVRKINEIMGWEEATEEHNGEGELAWAVPNEDGTVKYVPVKCDIDIDNITFSYVEGTPVLKNVTAHANSGEKLAFVGSTGAGKTTITNLINRFYELDSGKITIDGIDIKDIEKKSLRGTMAFVLQDSKLFAGTIADNIRLGRLTATDEEVVAAAKLANADEFITKLKDGYDSKIRSDGVNISAGQAQLINIARAAISNRPLLVLDEATSSVDTRTERLIEVGMDSLMEDKTVLVIAHRLSTVRNSEDIVVLESGEIIEEGNHTDLIKLAGKYYQLYTGTFELT